MKRFITSDDYIVSLDELLAANEFDALDIQALNNLRIGETIDYGNTDVMRIGDGQHLSSHDTDIKIFDVTYYENDNEYRLQFEIASTVYDDIVISKEQAEQLSSKLNKEIVKS